MQNYFAKSLVIGSIMTASTLVFGATPVEVVALKSNVDMFVNRSGVAIPITSYTNGKHVIYGDVQFLRSGSPGYTNRTTTVEQRLQSTAYASGKLINSYVFAGASHQRTYESGYIGQCVGFAKFMTGAPGNTGTWRTGRALANIFPNGKAVNGTADMLLVPGSMIAHFGGQSIYNSPDNKKPHVAIVLSVAEINGVIQGINVVDQNGLSSAEINGIKGVTVTDSVGGGSIVKHFLPWNANSSDPTLSAKNYHVVAQCPAGQQCP
jgi:hypothetical protein